MFDRIIVSTDENPMFLQFVPIVSKAWKKYFPEKKLSIAFVSSRDKNDNVVKEMSKYGDVKVFKPVEGIPTANQAKISRHILASYYENEISMIEDMDTIPLQRKYFEDRTSSFKGEGILAVGHEVFETTQHEGKFPMSTMTAKGDTWKTLINPNNSAYENIIKSFIDIAIFDHKEAISKSPDIFSDESLMRALISKWNGKIVKVKRNVDIHLDWIDRSWWGIDLEKLKLDGYICCNFLRPFEQNFENIKPIADYIFGKDVDINDKLLRS